MSRIEKLIEQVFERKRSFLDQVQHQIDLYDQQLASRAIIDGITPPSWLWNPATHSHSSEPCERKKETLISELLLLRSPTSIPYHTGHNSLNNKIDVTVNKGYGPTFLPQCHLNDAGCVPNTVPEFEPKTMSPQCKTGAKIMDTPDQSLEKFQRSKLKQKALEIPHSMRESCSHYMNEHVLISSEIEGFTIASLQSSDVNEVEIVNTSNLVNESNGGRSDNISNCQSKDKSPKVDSERITRSSCQQSGHVDKSAESHSSYYIANHDGVILESNGKTSQQYNNITEVINLIDTSHVNKERCRVSEAVIQDKTCKRNRSNGYCGRVTRSRNSCQQLDSVDMSPKLVNSSDIILNDDGALQQDLVKDVEAMSSQDVKAVPVNSTTSIQTNLQSHEGSPVKLLVNKEDLPDDPFRELHTSIQNIDGPTFLPPCHLNNADCISSTVPEMEPKTMSPQCKTYAKIMDTPDQSLAKFQRSRSKSRQKALELRNSVRAVPRSRLCDMDDNALSSSGIDDFTVAFLQSSDVNEVDLVNTSNVADESDGSRPEKISNCQSKNKSPKVYSGRVDKFTKPNSSYYITNHDGVIHKSNEITPEQHNHVTEALNLTDTSDVNNEGCRVCEAVKDDKRSLENDVTLLEPVHFTKESYHPKIDDSIAMDRSWPNYKRRKMENQLTHVLSAPPSLTVKALEGIHKNAIDRYSNEEEASSQVVLSSPDGARKNDQSMDTNLDIENGQNTNGIILEGSEDSQELQKEQGDLRSERRHRSETTFKFEQEHIEPSLSSSLTKLKTVGSQGCLMEEKVVSNQMSSALDVRIESTVEENQSMYDQFNAEISARSEQTLHENKSIMGDDGIFSYCSVGSLHTQFLDSTDADQYMPDIAGFSVETDDKQSQIIGADSFHEENLPNCTLEHANVLEQLYKSGSMHTPLSDFSNSHNLHETRHLYQSVPNGLLEQMELKDALHLVDDSVDQLAAGPGCRKNEIYHDFQSRSYSDGVTLPRPPFDWESKNHYISPTGKLWEGTRSSNFGFSEKQRSSNPELICFPIAEDPTIYEEIGNTDEVIGKVENDIGPIAIKNSRKRGPLADSTKSCESSALVCEGETLHDRVSLDSAITEFNSVQSQNKVKQKPSGYYDRKRRCTSKAKENKNLSLNANGNQKRESKRNNIVSNIASFVPLVKQNQSHAVTPGKRDIKVKALEAAEAARRLAEKKENERKMKKEALKIERAKMEREKLRQLELKKKIKEEAQKKKDADVVERRRAREEEEKKAKEGKRRRVDELRRQQREQDKKLNAGKQAKEKQTQATDLGRLESKESKIDKGQHRKVECKKEADNQANIHKESMVVNDGGALGDIGVVMNDDNLHKYEEYDMSPYQGSDEEEDDFPNNKFIPSWASSKNSMALAVSSQQQMDVNAIFPPERNWSIEEVLLPRKK